MPKTKRVRLKDGRGASNSFGGRLTLGGRAGGVKSTRSHIGFGGTDTGPKAQRKRDKVKKLRISDKTAADIASTPTSPTAVMKVGSVGYKAKPKKLVKKIAKVQAEQKRDTGVKVTPHVKRGHKRRKRRGSVQQSQGMQMLYGISGERTAFGRGGKAMKKAKPC